MFLSIVLTTISLSLGMAVSQYPIKPLEYTPGPGWILAQTALDHSEVLLDYGDDGLCPIILDDVLVGHDLYEDGKTHSLKVVGKLGHGSYSTVWLVRDL